MFKFVHPSTAYANSYLLALEEFQREGRHLDKNLAGLRTHSRNLSALIAQILEQSSSDHNTTNHARTSLPEGWVPHTEYWLVQFDGDNAEDGDFIGRFDVRYSLASLGLKLGGHIGYEIRPSKRGKGYGRLMVQLGLEKVKEDHKWLERLLITCDERNIASKRIIQGIGATFSDRVVIDDGKGVKLRYWVCVKNG